MRISKKRTYCWQMILPPNQDIQEKLNQGVGIRELTTGNMVEINKYTYHLSYLLGTQFAGR